MVEYLNGRKNGECKEYDNINGLEFEGIYIDGIRWTGKGSEYNSKGNLVFEGEYLDGKRWNGLLIEYGQDGSQVIFYGNVVEGIKFSIE